MIYLIYRNDNKVVVATAYPQQDLQRVMNNFNYIEAGVSSVKYYKQLDPTKEYVPIYWNEETGDIEYAY
jgi:hypothetical protein